VPPKSCVYLFIYLLQLANLIDPSKENTTEKEMKLLDAPQNISVQMKMQLLPLDQSI
jgi:hypothetical protein